MILQTQFPFQQNAVGKSPLIAILITVFVLLVILAFISKFEKSEALNLERLNSGEPEK